MKRFALALLSLAAVLVSPAVFSQTPPTVPASLNVNWVPPTESACLQPAPATCVRVQLTGQYALTGFQLYVSTSPIPDNYTGAVSATLGAGVSTTSYNTVVPNGSTVYVRVRATNAFGASVMSGEVTKVVVVPAGPREPTGVTITLTIGV